MIVSLFVSLDIIVMTVFTRNDQNSEQENVKDNRFHDDDSITMHQRNLSNFMVISTNL